MNPTIVRYDWGKIPGLKVKLLLQRLVDAIRKHFMKTHNLKFKVVGMFEILFLFTCISCRAVCCISLSGSRRWRFRISNTSDLSTSLLLIWLCSSLYLQHLAIVTNLKFSWLFMFVFFSIFFFLSFFINFFWNNSIYILNIALYKTKIKALSETNINN